MYGRFLFKFGADIKSFAGKYPLFMPSGRFFSTNVPFKPIQTPESLPKNCIVFDGSCPVCTLAVKKLKMSDKMSDVATINAREHPELVKQYKAKGYDLDKGMIVSGAQGEVHFGAEAIKEMGNKMGGLAGWFLNSSWMKSVYPLIRMIRNSLIPQSIAEEISEKEATKVEGPTSKMN